MTGRLRRGVGRSVRTHPDDDRSDAGSAAGTALRLHGTDGFDDSEERYAVAAKGRRVHLPAGLVVRESRPLTADDVMVVAGVRTVTRAVALAHAAPILGPDAAVRRQRILRAGR